jgi:hypothetical protein
MEIWESCPPVWYLALGKNLIQTALDFIFLSTLQSVQKYSFQQLRCRPKIVTPKHRLWGVSMTIGNLSPFRLWHQLVVRLHTEQSRCPFSYCYAQARQNCRSWTSWMLVNHFHLFFCIYIFVGIIYLGYRRPPVTAQNFGYVRFPLAVNGCGTIHPVPGNGPTTPVSRGGATNLKELISGIIHAITSPRYD